MGKRWFIHDNSGTFFLEDENYTVENDEITLLKYDDSVGENEVEKLHRRDAMKHMFDLTNGVVEKPKINNWSTLLNNVRSIYDAWNLKVKHATEEYMNLPHAPEPDDLIHLIFSKKKSLFSLSELLEIFGEQRRETVENSLTWLLDKRVILGYPFQDGNILEKWEYAESDNFCINVNYNG